MATPNLAHVGLLRPSLQGTPAWSGTSEVLAALRGAAGTQQLPRAVPHKLAGQRGPLRSWAQTGQAGRARCRAEPHALGSRPMPSPLPLCCPARPCSSCGPDWEAHVGIASSGSCSSSFSHKRHYTRPDVGTGRWPLTSALPGAELICSPCGQQSSGKGEGGLVPNK